MYRPQKKIRSDGETCSHYSYFLLNGATIVIKGIAARMIKLICKNKFLYAILNDDTCAAFRANPQHPKLENGFWFDNYLRRRSIHVS